MEAIYTSEGRLYFADGVGRYEYTLSDHLGNNRITFSDLNSNGSIEETTEVLQENHYYPFGMAMNGDFARNVGKENKYLYNGKELDTDFGLNWYHYGFRMYDPAIARFTSIDPLAETYSFQSPYTYAANNPISFIDYLGLGPIYGPDGTLIGWEVEEGEGPTQIAQKLNESYGCELTCEINYIDIIQDNPEQFENVINEDGSVKDKSSEDYKSGNIDPGDALKIDGGKKPVSTEKLDIAIEKTTKSIDSMNEIIGELKRWEDDAAAQGTEYEKGTGGRGDPGSGATGAALASRVRQAIYELRGRNKKKIRDRFVGKKDSLETVKNKINE